VRRFGDERRLSIGQLLAGAQIGFSTEVEGMEMYTTSQYSAGISFVCRNHGVSLRC
jgi:hypothetical protein